MVLLHTHKHYCLIDTNSKNKMFEATTDQLSIINLQLTCINVLYFLHPSSALSYQTTPYPSKKEKDDENSKARDHDYNSMSERKAQRHCSIAYTIAFLENIHVVCEQPRTKCTIEAQQPEAIQEQQSCKAVKGSGE